jgi:hypothetical protein
LSLIKLLKGLSEVRWIIPLISQINIFTYLYISIKDMSYILPHIF